MTHSSVKFLRRTVWECMDEEEMVARYEAGASLGDLGMLTGTSYYRVRKVLVAQGVTIRPPRRQRKSNPVRHVRKS